MTKRERTDILQLVGKTGALAPHILRATQQLTLDQAKWIIKEAQTVQDYQVRGTATELMEGGVVC